MKKFENFKAALVNLNDIFSYKEPYGNVEIAGTVSYTHLKLPTIA